MPDADPNMPALVVEGGALDGFTMNIQEGTTVVVGSGRLANLRIDHPEIELAHVKVTWDNLGIAMRDNGSRHGTWVDNEQVESAALLDNDVISFMPPDSPSSAPRVRVRIPEGTVAEPLLRPRRPRARPSRAPPRGRPPPHRWRSRRSPLPGASARRARRSSSRARSSRSAPAASCCWASSAGGPLSSSSPRPRSCPG